MPSHSFMSRSRAAGARRPLVSSMAAAASLALAARGTGFALHAALRPAGAPRAHHQTAGGVAGELAAAVELEPLPQGSSSAGPAAVAALLACGGAAAAAVGASRLRQGRALRHGAGEARGTLTAAKAADATFSDVCEQTGVTLNRYMIEMNKQGVVDADIVSIFNSMREATKVIAKLVNRAPLSQAELLGLEGEVNVQGEDQKKLDVITNDVLKRALQYTGKLGTLASEEEDEPVVGNYDSGDVLSRGEQVLTETGNYVCVFDPLDGSSNVDAGIAVGTIFGIFRESDEEECQLPVDMSNLNEEQANCLASTLQPGKALVAAGYVLYSCSTELVFTLGQGCVGFTLDSSIGEYVMTRPSIKIPSRGKIYSANEANIDQWDKPMQDYVRALQEGRGETGKQYSLRYIGSMVGDVHRTLLYGGVFAYPADKKNLNGKLRLLYEAAPMAFILEQAGGKATTGHSRVMDIPPVQVHQRVPIILGSTEDVEECEKYFAASDDPEIKKRCDDRLKGVLTPA